ncbi:MAG: protein phosphatase 2C domain-containing protein [Planctomycetota bacterium]
MQDDPTSTLELLALDRGVLRLASEDGSAVEWRSPLGTAVVISSRGHGKRTNEDGVLVLQLDESRVLVAVADGMGGLPDGDRAARLTLEALAHELMRADRDADLGAALATGFERANDAVIDGAEGAGATLVAAVIGPATVRVVHAGDAEALVVGQRGKLKLRTIAHSPTAAAHEAGLITEREAMMHAERHIVSNAIGLLPLTIEVGPEVPLGPRDTLVLGSDGLFDNLTLAEVVDAARCGPPKACATALAAFAWRRMDGVDGPRWPGKPDDLSLVVFRRVTPPTARSRRQAGANPA